MTKPTQQIEWNFYFYFKITQLKLTATAKILFFSFKTKLENSFSLEVRSFIDGDDLVAFPETEKQILWILGQSFTISLLYGLKRDHQIRLNTNLFNQIELSAENLWNKACENNRFNLDLICELQFLCFPSFRFAIFKAHVTSW